VLGLHLDADLTIFVDLAVLVFLQSCVGGTPQAFACDFSYYRAGFMKNTAPVPVGATRAAFLLWGDDSQLAGLVPPHGGRRWRNLYPYQ